MIAYGLCIKTNSDLGVTTVVTKESERSQSFIRNSTSGYASLKRSGKWINPLYYGARKQAWSYSQGEFTDTVNKTGKFSQSWQGVLDSSITSYCPGAEFPSYEFTYDEKSRLHALIDQAILLKLKNSRINLAQSFAERQQTVDLIGTTARRLAAGFSSLRKGNLADFAQAIGMQTPSLRRRRKFSKEHLRQPWLGACNAWLEYSYGWRPLLADVYAATDIFSKELPRPMNVSSQQTLTVSNGSTVRGTYISSALSWRSTLRYRKKIFYALDDNASSSLIKSASEIGLTNPALLAWELMPYSFVADWFVPVGSYLSTLDATFGLTFKSGIFDDKWDRESSRVCTGNGVTNLSSVSTTGSCSSRYSDLWFERKVLSSFPTPALPSIKNPLSTGHALSAISLLSQTFLRRS